jgi:predicted RecB family nuclease
MGRDTSSRGIPLLAYPIKSTALVCEEEVVKDSMPRTYPKTLEVPMEGLAAHLAEEGILFEAEIYARLAGILPADSVADLSALGEDRTAAGKEAVEVATLAAVLDPSVTCILNPRLGRHFLRGWEEARGGSLGDAASLWTSEPDVVLVDRSGDAVVLLPVDVKHHATRGSGGVTTRRISSLEEPFPQAGIVEEVRKPSSGTFGKDALQLAHYIEHLRAWGLAGPDAIAGVIGSEEDVVWLDLAAEKVQRKPVLELYAQAQDRYRTLVTNGRERDADPGVPRLTGPELKEACGMCGWRDVCLDELKADYPGGHITLLAGVTPTKATPYYAQGIEGIAQLAAATVSSPDDVNVVRARSWLNGDVVRKAEVPADLCPSADVEFDFDIEWTQGRSRDDIDEEGELVYAWGCLENGPDGEHLDCLLDWELSPAPDWDTDAGEAQAFAAFWARITDSRATAQAAGRTWLAFHYTDPEPSRMRRLAGKHAGHPGVPSLAEVEALLTSGEVLDLVDVVRSLIWPLGTNGLKDVAKFTGFRWRAVDAGGDMSTLWRLQALVDPDPAARADVREKLRDYNADDVLAQRAVRMWLREHAAEIREWPTQ